MDLICKTCKHYSEKYDYCVALEYTPLTAYHTGKCFDDSYEKGEPSEEVIERNKQTDEYLKEIGEYYEIFGKDGD